MTGKYGTTFGAGIFNGSKDTVSLLPGQGDDTNISAEGIWWTS